MSIEDACNLTVPFFCLVIVPVFLDIMASMPFGMFAAQKVRNNMALTHPSSGSNWQKESGAGFINYPTVQYMDASPSKYCDKMMNSIWGLYNRYSVHNFKSSATSAAQGLNVQQHLASKEAQDWLQVPIKSPLDGIMQMKF